MIRLIRKDGVEMLLNTEAIQSMESSDGTVSNCRTVITLVNGEKLEVKNHIGDLTTKSKAYVKGINQERKEFEKTEKDKEKGDEKPGKKKKNERRYSR